MALKARGPLIMEHRVYTASTLATRIYTVVHKKVHPFSFYNKFVKCWLMLVIFDRNVV